MPVNMIFIIAAPRSGSTLLERMLSSHSRILGGPEPHLMTPLAHLGYWDRVDAAPYDPEHAAAELHRFVEALPGGEADYWAACRAYADVLYGRRLEGSGKDFCLDKTPAYALILPFLMKVYPDARYVVLTRHPLALFSSFANSFFDGDYFEAQRYNPILNRYVPALASFLRQREVPHIHVRYEDLVREPETWLERIYGHIGVPHEPGTVEYGRQPDAERPRGGLGDPIGVDRHTRPNTASVKKWVEELAGDPARLALMRGVIEPLDVADLEIIGYPKDELWKPLEDAPPAPPRKPESLTLYRLQRRAIVRLRHACRREGVLRRAVAATRRACDALLRD